MLGPSLAGLAMAGLLGISTIDERPPTVRVAPSLVKIRPDRALPGEAQADQDLSLVAARGECEAGQVIVSAGDAPIDRLDVRAFPLVRNGEADGAAPAALLPVVYRQAFVEVLTPSNLEGDVGPWPDPLIPSIDPVAGEPRNAFPVVVPRRWHQPVLVEVCVPRDAAVGRYDGEVVVYRGGRARERLRMHVDVRPPVLPARSSLPVTFGLSGKSLLFGHYGERDEARRLELVHRYARVALRHRISLHAMSLRPPRAVVQDGKLQVDFSEWDREIAQYLDGSEDTGGASFSAIDLRTPEELAPAFRAEYYRRVEAHFRERGWLDRLFAYVMDEPKPEQMRELHDRLRALEAAPAIRRLVTIPLTPELVGLVDIWAPNLNCLVMKERPDEFCHRFAPREKYAAREKAGERVWWYQSCSSHGCRTGPTGNTSIDRYFTGWPRYVIDADGPSARVMGWLAFSQEIGGELYFDTVHAYNFWDRQRKDRRDPWDDVHHFGGNGDGTLFYPGRPDRIGGSTHVPVESLRLKHIRDGLEDYELLTLLASRGEKGRKRAKEIAQSLAPEVFRFEHRISSWTRARRLLFAALAETEPEPEQSPQVSGASTRQAPVQPIP